MQVISEKEMLARVNIFRGVFACLIVIGHASMCFEKELLPLFLIHKFNGVGVCYFLFISSWGLAYNFDKKEGYLKGFLLRKVSAIIACVLLWQFIREIVTCLINKQLWTVHMFWNDIVRITWNWYIYEIIFFYIVFAVVYYFVRGKINREIIIYSVTIIMCLFYLYIWKYVDVGWKSRSYFTSALLFPFGIMAHDYYSKIENKTISRPVIKTCLFFLGAVVCCFSYTQPEDSFLFGILMRNGIGICLMVTLMFICNLYVIQQYLLYNNILIFLKKISLEIYLYQFIILSLLQIIYLDLNRKVDLIFVFLSLIITVLVAIPINYLDNKIKTLLLKRKKM